MHSLKFNFARIAFACLLLTVGFASTASADTTFHILIDDDGNPGNNCSYSNPAGTFSGAERRLVVVVSSTGTVAPASVQQCTGGVFNPVSTSSAVLGNDALPGGIDVLETSLALNGQAGTFRLGFFSEGPTDFDALTVDDNPPGAPITVVAPVILGTTDIPTLGIWGFLALALGLLAAGLLVLRRRRGAGAVLGVLLILVGAGVAWAAVIMVDGIPTDWDSPSLPPPPASTVATDGGPAAAVNADILAARAVVDMGILFFRIDAHLDFNAPPTAVDDSYSATLDTPLSVAAAGVLANDTLNGAVISSYGAVTGAEQTTIGGATPTSAGGSVTLNADGSFNYTPPAGFLGSDTFKYVLQNANGTSTATVTLTVGKKDQTITFTSTAPVGAVVGGPTYTVTATATSGLPVTFAIHATASTVCSIAGSTVSFIGAGTCVITANQAGDASYNPAPQAQQSFPVGQGTQTISFTSTAPVGAVVGGPTYNVTAMATSGLPVTFTIDASASAVCSIAGSTVSFTGIGTCVINANQAGDANYAPAPQVQQSFPVGQGTQTITFTSTAPVGATVGGPTYNVTAMATSGLPVTLTIDASASTVCSIAGSTVSFIGIGTCVINADQAGDANYAAAPQVQQSFPVGQGTQTISFTSTPPVGATAGSPPYNVTATATSGLPVTFTIDASASTVCSVAGSSVSFIGTGTCVINANQAGDASYAPAPQVQQSFPVGQGTQTISFTSTAPVGATAGGPTYNVTATATSGLPVTFTIDASASTVCSVAGSTVSFIGIGTCVINANQAGDANYAPAPQVQQSFPVGQGTQTITFTSTAPVGAVVGGPTYNVTATATSGLPVTFTIDASASTVCSIAGSTVSFTGIGTCVINANQAGDANYAAAPQVQQSFSVGQGTQTISFTSTAPVGAVVGGPTYTVTATATSGLPVTFTIDPSASTVCSIAGSTVSFIGVGTCVINANQAGDANYAAAPQVQQSFPVGQGTQTISFTSTAPVGAVVGGPTYNVTATATSGLPVTFTIDPSASTVCSIAGSTVSFIGVGTCVINANQAGDANYAAAPQVQQSFPVGQGTQTITFTSAAPAATVGGPPYNVTATATSGLPVTFTIDASASTVCSIAGSTVSFIGVGTCVINANQAGNANYAAAPQVQQSFPVGQGSQTISFTSAAPVGATVGGPTYTVTAVASPSGLPVTFTIDASASTVCTIAGSTVSFIGAGTCVINANQAGDANYAAAPQVQQSFPVGPGSQTITFTSSAPVGATAGGPTYTVTATATSGLPVTFTIDASASTVCSIAGSTVSFIGGGTCVINANQAGNANYTAAPQVQQSFLVVKQDQTITFTSTPPALATIGGPTYTVTATATSGLPVTFTIDGSASSVCTIAGSTVSFIGGGTCVINANQAGNAIYNAAPQVQQSFAVNQPPQLVATPKEAFDTVGNTGFEFKTAQSLSPGIFVMGRLKDNFTDVDGPSPLSVVAITDGPTTNGGEVDVDINGEFTFTPKAGDTAVSDSFSYQITDGAYTLTRTVTINRKERVWYVRNNAPAGGLGRSNDPFDTLVEAQTASLANDYIFVYFGNGLTTGQAGGIVLKNGQHLIGEHAGLTVRFNPAITFNGTPGTTSVPLVTPPDADDCGGNPCRPFLDHTGAGGIGVSATDAIPAEIVGLNLAGNGNAIDITTNGAFAGSGLLTIRDNVIRAAGAEGVDINAGGTGTVTLAVHDNTLTSTGTAIDIARTNGTLIIAALDDNVVSGNTGGSGIVISGPATFNSTSVGGAGPVPGGNTVIGALGNPVTGAGLVLNNVTGALDFTDLDIFAGGAGLVAQGTGAFTGATGTRITVTPASPDGIGTGMIDADNGAAVDITSATIDLRLDRLESTTSGSGVNLNTVGGQFRAPSGSSISKTSGGGTAFSVANSASGTTVNYAGTLNVTSGSGVSLSSNTGSTISFSGGMTLSTGANAGFSATGGGTVTVTDPPGLTNNTITTTSGTALNVTGTTIGASGLTFERISTNGATNGIVLNNTGASGGLTITGNGGANSGGVIQSSTGDGISLTSTRNIALNRMRIASSGGSHIDASTVTNLTLNNVDTDTSNDHGILGSSITNLTISGGTFHRGGAGAEPTCNLNGVSITNLLGTSSVTGATFTRSNTIQFRVNNTATSGSVDTLMVSGTTWGTHTGPCSGDHLSVNADTGGNFKLITNGSAGENNFTTGGIGVQASAGGSGTMQASITGVQTSGNTAGVAIVGTASSNISFNVFNNNTANGTGFSGTGSVALVLTCTSSGICQGAFDNNSITHTAGTSTNAMQVVVEGNGTGRVTVSNNTVNGNFQRGLQGQSRAGTGSLSLHVTGNNFTATDATGLQVMNFEVGASGGGTTNSLCLNLGGGGALSNTATPAGAMSAYRLLHRTGYTYQLQNLAQASTTNTADVQTWVTTTKANTGTPVSVTVGASPFTTSAGCSTPTLPSP